MYNFQSKFVFVCNFKTMLKFFSCYCCNLTNLKQLTIKNLIERTTIKKGMVFKPSFKCLKN